LFASLDHPWIVLVLSDPSWSVQQRGLRPVGDGRAHRARGLIVQVRQERRQVVRATATSE
jgi:hypothetical protein